ncbi:CXXC motif containing zinc binding protein [Colletes gigas]|uniref:CXXC motif containing zinc binding protein n=1 Tax=Colletes gigas TaxID=935657 RepID=UPI001C9A69E9|nr:CXXC motif containing zinc binding protein [Colletes gigas]
MVKIALKIKATLQSIDEVKPSGQDFRWYLKFTCSSCGEKSEKWNYASLSESTPLQKRNAVTHFTSKCKLCSRENSMSILEDTVKSYKIEKEGEFQTIVVFDCRGFEPNDFSPRDGWIAKTENHGTTFTDVDLSEGEWSNYCVKTKQVVGIYEVEHKFERVK